jgi:hypothetical protein
MGMLTELVQKQLIDPHFTSNNSKKVKAALSPNMKKALDRAISENPQSDIVFVLDPDTLPIASKLRLRQLEMAEKYRKSQAVSFKDAAEWAGLDRPSNAADEMIYIATGEQRIDTQTVQQVKELTDKLANLETKLAEQHTESHFFN